MPDSLGHLAELWEAGAYGFKCFLLDSGVPEFPPLSTAQLRAAMAEIAAFDGLLVVHAEDPEVIAAHGMDASRAYDDFLASRPPEAETTAIATVIAAARETGCRVHVVHLSAADALPAIAAARAEGVRLTVETCPHYLTLDAESVPDGQTQFKCCPPVRGGGERRPALAGARRRGRRLRGLRPLPLHPRAQGARGGRLRRRVGRDLLAAARPAAGLDGGAAARDRPGHGRRLDVGRHPPGSSGWDGGATSPSAPPPTSSSSRPTRPGRCAPPSSSTATRSRRTRAATVTGRVRRTYLAGVARRPLRRRRAGSSSTAPTPVRLAAMPHFTTYPDLASRDLAGRVVSANDELFAPRQSLNLPGPAVHAVDAFGHLGKVYDGWETRRRRSPGFDWAIVRLGVPGIVHGVVVDTAFFKGNYPPFVSVEGLSVEGYPEDAVLEQLEWTTLVERSPCEGDSENHYEVASDRRWTHVRLSIHPDGGVARFRVHGEVVVDPRFLTTTVDLLALENGGRLLDTSDAFYASPGNLILPGRARTTGEGWENARRRGDGNDWATFALAARGEPTLVELDTSFFIGNAPGEVRVQATRTPPPDRSTTVPGGTSCPGPRCSSTPVTSSSSARAARRPTCGSTSTPTAGSPGCAASARSTTSSASTCTPASSTRCRPEHHEFPHTVPVPPSRALPADEV